MNFEYTPVRELRPHPNNARTHSTKQIRQIARSIEQFGFCNPVLVDDTKQIIAGHGRVEAAKLLGIDAVPTCRLSHLSEADKRAYVLADNKLAEKAGWDRELLAIELQGLIELDVDIELTGFEMAEIDLILEEAREASGATSGPEDQAPEPSPGSAVSQIGDLWLLGAHRLLAGMRETKPPTLSCLPAPRRNSCSLIRLTTSPSMAMSAGSGAFGVANLRWAPAR
jgi:ParB-like chromosome segregation protein Spo0J